MEARTWADAAHALLRMLRSPSALENKDNTCPLHQPRLRAAWPAIWNLRLVQQHKHAHGEDSMIAITTLSHPTAQIMQCSQGSRQGLTTRGSYFLISSRNRASGESPLAMRRGSTLSLAFSSFSACPVRKMSPPAVMGAGAYAAQHHYQHCQVRIRSQFRAGGYMCTYKLPWVRHA